MRLQQIGNMRKPHCHKNAAVPHELGAMRIELKSKLVTSLIYDEPNRLLRLVMTNGQIRDFREVPKDTVERLADAKSPGEYYFKHIRGHFQSH
jgi:hypothetical protein